LTATYLTGGSRSAFVLLKPQRVHNPGVQHGHQQYRDNTSHKKPRGTVSLGKPFVGPVFHAKIIIFIIVDCQEFGNEKNCCRNPGSRYDDLENNFSVIFEKVNELTPWAVTSIS